MNKTKYQNRNGKVFSFDGNVWRMEEGILYQAAFVSKESSGATAEMLKKGITTYDELFSDGNDPFTEEGFLFYRAKKGEKESHSGLLKLLNGEVLSGAKL